MPYSQAVSGPLVYEPSVLNESVYLHELLYSISELVKVSCNIRDHFEGHFTVSF